jgi:uncharacterized protein (DUF58 family)
MKWFLGALLMLLMALILESGLMAYAMYVLLAVMLGSRLLARVWIANLSATRTCDGLVREVGEVVTVELVIRNTGMLPVPWVILEDRLPPAAFDQKPPRLRIKGKRMQIRMLWAKSTVKSTYEITCDMRGYYQIGPMVMESGDLFGLHRRYRVDAEPHYLLVYPKVLPLGGYDLASRRPIGDVRLIHRLYEDPTRIAGVRPYQIGDPLSRVHWRATARTGQLHSKIHEPSTLAGATIVLDFHEAGFHRQGEPHRSELAVTTAASLANALYELGQQVGLVSSGRDAVDRIRKEGPQHDFRTRQAAQRHQAMAESSERLQPVIVETRRGVEQFQRIREMLARLEFTSGLTLPQLIEETSARLPRDATVVAVMGDVPVESALTLGNLRRQGFAVAALLIMLSDEQHEKAFGRLRAEGIMDIRHLKGESDLENLCQQQTVRAAAYQLHVDLI